jgi:hypothetical protein
VRRWRSAPIDTLSELRQLADALSALGDDATAALVRKAIDPFLCLEVRGRRALA